VAQLIKQINMENVTELGDFKPFTQSLESIATKFLSDRVKGFKAVNVHEQDVDRNNVPIGLKKNLFPAYLSTIVVGHEVGDEDVKEFCDLINKLAEDDIIEYGRLAPLTAMNLTCGPTRMFSGEVKDLGPCPRTLVMFYTYSKYDIEDQKRLGSKHFVREGEFYNDQPEN
jgi:hypothetical protein